MMTKLILVDATKLDKRVKSINLILDKMYELYREKTRFLDGEGSREYDYIFDERNELLVERNCILGILANSKPYDKLVK